ncbi:hypothetical protein HPP92_026933 [Vanilla planifolia]|uniref:Protein SDA1 n=1 Tax=Vanilla planifolia TaxID=51239 RepID=A0A835PB15_VANPL|nr:hypothetical protein HPP92_026933 [Vanilla planifolia]
MVGEEELRARVMVSALSFLLGYECVDDDDDDSEASSDEDDEYIQNPQIVLSREVVYKALEPLLRQIVNQFVRDHSRPEAIAVGLNVVCEMCLRMPLMVLACKWLPLKATALYAFLPASNLVQVEKSCCMKGAVTIIFLKFLHFIGLRMKWLLMVLKLQMIPYQLTVISVLELHMKKMRISVENDGEFFPGSGQSSDIDGLEDDAYRNDSDEEGSDDGKLANVCDTEELNEELEVQAIPIDGQDEDADDGKGLQTDDGDKEYEQGGSEQEVTWKRPEQNIDDNDELVGKGKKVSSPQLIVLHGISGDGVWATKVKQKERRPECEDGVVAIVVLDAA